MSSLKAAKKDTTKIKSLSSSMGRSTTPGHAHETDDNSYRVRAHMLEKDLERRQESYIARERAYKARIEDLEEELNAQKTLKTGWMKSDSKVAKLKGIHSKILENVELVQERTARILQDQERDLLRAFRARLFDVQTELEKEKSKKDDGAGAWIERSRQLESEVEWAKEVADRLERVNQALTQENSRLKTQFHSQEDDRNFLIQQLVSVKKDNERLRLEYTAIEAENKALVEEQKKMELNNNTTNTNSGNNNMGITQSKEAKAESDERYKEVNVRLRRLLADERKALAVTRQNYAAELRSRTEMELLLRQCVEEVRKEIAKKHIEQSHSNKHTNGDFTKLYQAQHNGGANIPIEDFTQEDRERALELLLSQERVVTLLYAKAFPVTSNGNASGTNKEETNALARKGPVNALLGGIGMDDDAMTSSASERVLPNINNGNGNRPRTSGSEL